MRAWLYDQLTTDSALADLWDVPLAGMTQRVYPRESKLLVPSSASKPFLMYGLGQTSPEDLAEADDHEAYRQFLQIWVHDEGGDYDLIDRSIEVIKARLKNASHPASMVVTVFWLENSQEFANETYGTIFRYSRFQAILAKGKVPA